jgi:Kelch motif
MAAATAAPDGLLYIVEGFEAQDSDSTTNVSTYDPATGVTTRIAPMPAPLSNIGSNVDRVNTVSIGNIVYAIADAHFFAYDITTKTWSTKTNRSSGVYGMAAAVGSDGKIYVAGGQYANSGANATPAVYDPTTDAWADLPDSPYHDIYQVGAFANGKFYMYGTAAAAYDLASSTWSTLPTPTILESDGAGGWMAGTLVLAGGVNKTAAVEAPSSTLQSFDLTTNKWTTLASMSKSSSAAAAAVGCDGRLWLFGGEDIADDGDAPLTTVQAYDAVHNSWTQSP